MRLLERGILTLIATWFVTLTAVAVHVGSAWFPAVALFSPFLVLLCWNPTCREIGWSLLLGAIAYGLYNLHGGTWGPSFGAHFVAWMAFAGAGCITRMWLAWAWTAPAERAWLTQRLRCAAFMPSMSVTAGLLLGVAAKATPLTFDRLLMASDLKFGVAPAWEVARWLVSHPICGAICDFVYNSLPVVISLCLVIDQRGKRTGIGRVAELQYVAIATAISGFILFQFCPAAGPYVAFTAQFPTEAPQVLDVAPSWLPFAPRNSMPSLHFAAVLILLWNLRGRGKWLVSGLFAFSAITAISTLSTGQHYFVDLIASPALVVANQALCSRINHPARWIVFGAAAALTVGWIATIRSGFFLTLGPAATWLLAGFAALVPIALAAILERQVGAAIGEKSSPGRLPALRPLTES